MKEFLQSADRILIPKGDDRAASIRAFQEAADTEVPEFKGEQLKVTSDGRTFWLLKGKDIPGLVANGYADIGVTGTDSIIDYDTAPPGPRVQKMRLGSEAMCRFSLLTFEDRAQSMQTFLDSTRTMATIATVTSRPKLLGTIAAARDLPVIPMDIQISGSVEGAMSLLSASLAADIVDSGETARQNGLVEVRKLIDIYPELVFGMSEGRNENNS